MPSSTATSRTEADEAALLPRDRQPLYRDEVRTGAETREVANGLNVDIDAQGEVVGFDIDFASKRFDLSQLETIALPLRKTIAA